jgi:hypothetical protein
MNRYRCRAFPLRLLLVLASLQLLACSPAPDEALISDSQKYYFVEALNQVEAGGRQLQSAELDEATLSAGLAMLDQGLKLAFQVERESLDRLDLRLGKNFQRYFIAGVENYRIGIEAGDEAQQRKGLQLLTRWAEFWGQEGAAIQAKMKPG